jgi:hypothetical protein
MWSGLYKPKRLTRPEKQQHIYIEIETFDAR